jgi:hypothetical protein
MDVAAYVREPETRRPTVQTPSDLSGLDASALDSLDAITARRAARLRFGPIGEPVPGLPGPLEPPRRPDPTDDLHAQPSIGIAGVEFTQSIQYNGITSPTHGRDNAVQLVAYKTLVARVYPFVRRGVLVADTLTGQRVTGELTLAIGNRVVYQTGPTRVDGTRIGSTSRIERSLWDAELTLSGGDRSTAVEAAIAINCPLNFVVPAYYCKLGRVHATVRLWPVAEGPMSGRASSTTSYLQFIDVPAPKICLVRVNWVDSAGNVNRPTDAAMLATLGLAGRMLPFPYFDSLILDPEVTSSAPFAMLSPTPGGCNGFWLSLIADLNLTRIFTALFQLGDIVFAMVPTAAIPAGTGEINSGCGIGAGGGFVGFQETFAHEIGHLYDRPHVAVTNDPTNDPNYPNYGGSRRSIGEVGIDTGASPPRLFEPSSSDDIMSYGNNQWISPYTYQHILDARAMHLAAPVDPRRLRPLLVLEFRLHRVTAAISRVEVIKAARISAPGQAPARSAGAVSPVSLDLLDRDGRILATHHCSFIPAHGRGDCGCSGPRVPLEREPWLDFYEVVEWPGDAVASITFHCGEAPFATFTVGEPPLVSIEGPERRDGMLVVRVRANHPRERVSVVVLFSADGALTWRPIAFDPPRGEVAIEAMRVPGGPQCIFRAIGTAELQSATADTDPIDLPPQPRRLYLDVPSDRCAITPGPQPLSVMVDTRGLGAIAPEAIRWSSNLDGELGFGYSLAPELREGKHELTVSAPDGLGGTLNERAIIIVGGRPRR